MTASAGRWTPWSGAGLSSSCDSCCSPGRLPAAGTTQDKQLRRFALRFIHSHFSECTPGKWSRWRLPATVLDTLCLKMTPLPGYSDADHDRPRTRNSRPSIAQCTNIFSSKSPTLSLRTSALLLASVILAPSWKYRRRNLSQKTLVVPLCEWINRRGKRLNWHTDQVKHSHLQYIVPTSYILLFMKWIWNETNMWLKMWLEEELIASYTREHIVHITHKSLPYSPRDSIDSFWGRTKRQQVMKLTPAPCHYRPPFGLF